jgi:hypothetical protein
LNAAYDGLNLSKQATNLVSVQSLQVTAQLISSRTWLGELEQTLLTRFCMSQEVRILMQSTDLPPVVSDLKLAFSKSLNNNTHGTFWNNLWAFSPEGHISMPANLKEVPLPTWIHEKLKQGFLGQIENGRGTPYPGGIGKGKQGVRVRVHIFYPSHTPTPSRGREGIQGVRQG